MSINGTPTANRDIRGSIDKHNVLVVDAYDIAVKLGFNGTEKEWLASLKGDPGKDGENYIITEDDIDTIAQRALDKLEDGDGVSY